MKKIKSILTCILFIIAIQQLSAQGNHTICGNEQYKRQQDTSHENSIYQFIHQQQYKPAADGNKIIIPVVLHIVYRDEEENIPEQAIFEQMAELNRAYNNENDTTKIPEEFRPLIADMQIEFCLAGTDPQGNPTNGIIRTKTTVPYIGLDTSLYYTSLGGSDAWNTEKYLNIWVAGTDSYVLGTGNYPWNKTTVADGVVISADYFGPDAHSSRYYLGRTLVHEVGHYLGLYHLWDNGGCDSTNDQVNDTPPQADSYSGIPAYPQYSCGVSNMFMNYMDYVDDPLLLLFTKGQKERAMACLHIYRSELINSNRSQCNQFSPEKIMFDVYPNPASQLININYPYSDHSNLDVILSDAAGRKIMEHFFAGSDKIQIDISGIAPGIYFLKVGGLAKKIIKI